MSRCKSSPVMVSLVLGNSLLNTAAHRVLSATPIQFLQDYNFFNQNQLVS